MNILPHRDEFSSLCGIFCEKDIVLGQLGHIVSYKKLQFRHQIAEELYYTEKTQICRAKLCEN